ncbi:MAG: SIS domain-containing protein [Candidatus Dormibacteria bacterium]
MSGGQLGPPSPGRGWTAGDAARQLVQRHVAAVAETLPQIERESDRLARWARVLAATLERGGRLLAAGNGGSAAQAQHLTAELVGRYQDERRPFSAIVLHGDASALTALANDYGAEHIFARQVSGHGRRGDILITLSTSGESPNLLAAVRAARSVGMVTWALTGRPGSRLERACADALCVPGASVATVQELHLVAIHVLCEIFDGVIGGDRVDSSVPDRHQPATIADVGADS